MRFLFLLIVYFCFASNATAIQSFPFSRINFMAAQQQSGADEAASLSRKVIQLYNEGRIDEALPLAERTLALREQSLPASDPLLADALSNLGALYQAKKSYDKAEDFYKRALSVYESAGKPNSVNGVLDSLSLLRLARGDFSKAQSYAERALESKEKQLGADHIEVATTLTILIKIHEAQDDEKRAKPQYLRVISILEKKNAVVPEVLARVLASHACAVKSDKEEIQKRIDDLFVKTRPGVPVDAPVRGGVLNGKAVCLPKPMYPAIARDHRAQGTVVVQVVIDQAGKVMSAKAVSGAPELAAVSENAALKARFTPTYLAGYPVRVAGVITYNYVAR